MSAPNAVTPAALGMLAAMPATRIVPYADGGDLVASRDFYVAALGLEAA